MSVESYEENYTQWLKTIQSIPLPHLRREVEAVELAYCKAHEGSKFPLPLLTIEDDPPSVTLAWNNRSRYLEIEFIEDGGMFPRVESFFRDSERRVTASNLKFSSFIQHIAQFAQEGTE